MTRDHRARRRAPAAVTGVAVALLLALVPGALADAGGEDELNEEDFDTEPPHAEDGYLDEDPVPEEESWDASANDASNGNGSADEEEPTLTEDAFDVEPPEEDTSWLDASRDLDGTGVTVDGDADDDPGTGTTSDDDATGPAARTPGPGAVMVLAAAGAVAAFLRRGR